MSSSYQELLQNKRRPQRLSKDEMRRRCATGFILFLALSALAIGITALVLSIHYRPDPLQVNNTSLLNNTETNVLSVSGDSNLTDAYLSGDLKVANNTMVDTIQVMTRLTFPDCPSSITVGASAEFPTIQSVLDRYAGRVACPVKIIVPPGVYNENVALQGTTSSLRNAPVGRGLAIEGDTRFLAGLAFMDGGLHNRPANSSTLFPGSTGAAVSVSLSSGNQFTITVSGLDLSPHGYGAGDKLFIRDNSGASYTRNITNLTSTTVDFDGAALSNWAAGSYIVFQPNVQILPVDKNATLLVNGGNLAIQGVMMGSPVSNTPAQVSVMDGTLAMAQCFIEDRSNAAMANLLVSYNGHVTIRQFIEETGSSVSVLTAVGGFDGLLEENNGAIETGNLNQFDAQRAAVSCRSGALEFETIQFSHSTVDNQLAVVQQCALQVRNIKSISTGEGFAYIYVAGPDASLELVLSSRGIDFQGFENYVGIYAESGAKLNANFADITMTNAVYPVVALSGASVLLDASSDFSTAPTPLQYMADYASTLTLLNDFSSEGGNNMVYRHTANGDMFKANAFKQQEIDAGGNVELTLDPGLSGPFAYTHHDAKTYTVTDVSGDNIANHAITLQSGAVFEGCDVPAGSNRIAFDGTQFAQVTMFVRSVDRVRILDSKCVVFSIAESGDPPQLELEKKRSGVHPYYTGPMGAHYKNMTRKQMYATFVN